MEVPLLCDPHSNKIFITHTFQYCTVITNSIFNLYFTCLLSYTIVCFHLFFRCPFQALSGELSPFLCSASHLIQMDCHPSAIGTFLEAVLKCKPTPHIKSCLLKVRAKNEYTMHLLASSCLL